MTAAKSTPEHQAEASAKFAKTFNEMLTAGLTLAGASKVSWVLTAYLTCTYIALLQTLHTPRIDPLHTLCKVLDTSLTSVKHFSSDSSRYFIAVCVYESLSPGPREQECHVGVSEDNFCLLH